MFIYWLVRLVGLALQRLPLRVGYCAAAAAGDLTFVCWRVLWREKYRHLLDNMQHVLGPSADARSVRHMARNSLRNYCKYLADFFRFPQLTAEEIQRMVVFSGWEHIDAALAGGKGIVFIGLHMGNWDLGAAALALRNYPVNVIAETFRSARLNELIQGTRERFGMRVIPMEKGARRFFRTLQQNEILGLLIDRPAAENGVQVSFFGGPIAVPAGAAALALRTGAQVLTYTMVRLPNQRFLAMVDHGIDFRPNGSYQEDLQALTQCIMTSLEAMVRKYPDQWFMFRRMWLSPGG